jgi:hypothetical protein
VGQAHQPEPFGLGVFGSAGFSRKVAHKFEVSEFQSFKVSRLEIKTKNKNQQELPHSSQQKASTPASQLQACWEPRA